nr:ATP synthase F0 subunit 8 [Borysthenes sp. 2 WQW-2023a]
MPQMSPIQWPMILILTVLTKKTIMVNSFFQNIN